MPRPSVILFPFLFLTHLIAATPAAAQDSLPPWLGGMTASLGQPPERNWYAGASAGGSWQDAGTARPVGYATIGNHVNIGSPVTALLGASIEGFIGFQGDALDGGGRALLSFVMNRLQAGIEYDALDNQVAAMLAFNAPLRRGGIFGGGSAARLEWSVGSALRLSVLTPLAKPLAGRTRPRKDFVAVAARQSADAKHPTCLPELDAALANLRAAAVRIQQVAVPFVDPPGADPQVAMVPAIARIRAPAAPPVPSGDSGLDVNAIVRFYHAELARAFSIAASDQPYGVGQSSAQGDSLAQLARTALLQRAIYPYNRLLGQWKSDGTLEHLGAFARGDFAAQLASTSYSGSTQQQALYVFQALLDAVDSVRAREASEWGDNRLLWLPLQLGLLPEQHDTQQELDAVIENAVGKDFSGGNRVWYIINQQFQHEAQQSILAAKAFHVLWIHDFSGRDDQGQPDPTSLRFVVGSYLAALTEAAKRYDSVHQMPMYLIFLDQHYYERNDARVWLDILERPLEAVPHFGEGHENFADSVRIAQDKLRAAVEGSALLTAETQEYGKRWRNNMVKVQVNVTYPSDLSFWGPGILPVIGYPDNIMRDHRKILFYDLSPDDPYSGKALFTGVGIGEHYVGPTWEDRALELQGPGAFPLIGDARQLLLSQGLKEEEIPYPLRPRPLGAQYDSLIHAELAAQEAAGASDQRVMELHNLTGYQAKPINVARATLYNLMPPGSVVKIPDSLWGNALYAALLTGSALRGVRVLLVAPSLASAPSAGWPQMAATHDLFARLIVIQQQLGPELEAAGGMLKTGIYNPGIGVLDVASRFRAAYENGRRTPFLRRLFPIDSGVENQLLALMSAAQPSSGGALAEQLSPKLHMKASFFATREGWNSLITRPEMDSVFLAFLALTHRGMESISAEERAAMIAGPSQRLVTAFRRSLSPEARSHVAYYLMMGSANMDYRSMLMDGEVSVLVSGWSSVVGLIDFSLIVSLSVWVDDLQLLDDLLPPPSGFQRSVSRMVRPAL